MGCASNIPYWVIGLEIKMHFPIKNDYKAPTKGIEKEW